MHYSSIQVEVLLSKDVLFVVTERLNKLRLNLKLLIPMVIFHIESVSDFLWLLGEKAKDLLLGAFSAKSSHLFNLYAFYVWDDLLMLSTC